MEADSPEDDSGAAGSDAVVKTDTERSKHRNPFGRHGAVLRAVEHVPGVNHAVQRMHKRAGDDEAVERTKAHNPLRKDGKLCGIAERIPVVTNVMQGIHRAYGNEEEVQRAKDRDPFGHKGIVTQVAEHIPGVADGIRCIHKFRGHTEDAERARAYSLRKLVSKHGAVTKLAELLPGTNLIAAAVLELSGDHQEARRAINLLKQYKDAAGADGALAKIAELFPGTDVIAFGLQCNHGHYASALRTICKTRWVEISSKRTAVFLDTGAIRDVIIRDVQSDLEVTPKSFSLASGLMDLCIHLMDFNRQGEKRFKRHDSRGKADCEKHRSSLSVRTQVQDTKVAKANEAIEGVVGYITEQVPEWCGWGVDLTNWSVYEWEPATSFSKNTMIALYLLFPPMPYDPPPSLSPGAQLATVIQRSLPEVTAHHGPMPCNPRTFTIPPRRKPRTLTVRVLPEAAAVTSCLGFAGCLGLGLHTGGLGCLAGCVAGLTAFHRKAKEGLIDGFNSVNASVFEWMSDPPIQYVRNPRGGASQPFIAKSSEDSEVKSPQPTSPKDSGAASSAWASPGPRREADAVGRRPSSPKEQEVGRRATEPKEPDREGKKATADDAAASSSAAPRAKPDFPTGAVFDWPEELVDRLNGGLIARDYFKNEFCTLKRPMNWLHPMCLILGLFEEPLRRFLDDAVDGQAVPLVIPIPLPEGVYNGIQTWLPDIRVMLVLWFRFHEDGKYINRVTVALVDGMIDQIANVVKDQSLPPDLRDADPRLAEFKEPIDLKFNIALNWLSDSRLRLEINGISAKLVLPQ